MSAVGGEFIKFIQSLSFKAGKTEAEKVGIDIKNKLREQYESQDAYIEAIKDLIVLLSDCSQSKDKKLDSSNCGKLIGLFQELLKAANGTQSALEALHNALNTKTAINDSELYRRLEAFSTAYKGQNAAALKLKPFEQQMKTLCENKLAQKLWIERQQGKQHLNPTIDKGIQFDPYQALTSITVNRPVRMKDFQNGILKKLSELDKLIQLPEIKALRVRYMLLCTQANNTLAKNNAPITKEERLGKPATLCSVRINFETKRKDLQSLETSPLYKKLTTSSRSATRKIVIDAGPLQEIEFRHRYLLLLDTFFERGFGRDSFIVQGQTKSKGETSLDASISTVTGFLNRAFKILEGDKKEKAYHLYKATLDPSNEEDCNQLQSLIEFERLLGKNQGRQTQTELFETHTSLIEQENNRIEASPSFNNYQGEDLDQKLANLQAEFKAIPVDEEHVKHFETWLQALDTIHDPVSESVPTGQTSGISDLKIDTDTNGEAQSLQSIIFPTIASQNKEHLSYIKRKLEESRNTAIAYNDALKRLQTVVDANHSISRRAELIAKIAWMKTAIEKKKHLAEIDPLADELKRRVGGSGQILDGTESIGDLFNIYNQGVCEYTQQQISQAQQAAAESAELRETLKTVKANQDQALTTLSELQTRFNAAESEHTRAQATHKADILELKQKKEQASIAQHEAETALAAANREVVQLTGELAQLRTHSAAKEKNMTAQKSQVEAQLSQQTTANHALARQLAEQSQKSQATIDDLQASLEVAKTEGEAGKATLSDLQSSLNATRAKLTTAQSNHDAQVKQLQQQVEQLTQRAGEAEKDTEARVTELSNRLKQLETVKQVVEQQLQSSKQTLQAEQETVEALRDRLNVLAIEKGLQPSGIVPRVSDSPDGSEPDNNYELDGPESSDRASEEQTLLGGHILSTDVRPADSNTIDAVTTLINAMIQMDKDRVFTFFSGNTSERIQRISLLTELRESITEDNVQIRAKQVALLLVLPRSNGLCTKAIGNNYSANQLIKYLMKTECTALRQLLTHQNVHAKLSSLDANRWREHIRSFAECEDITNELQTNPDATIKLTDMSMVRQSTSPAA